MANDGNKVVDSDDKRGDAAADDDSLVRRHLRFAHLNLSMLKQMAHQQLVIGISDELIKYTDTPCWSCRAAKMTRVSYRKIKTRRSKRPFQKIISDMCYMGIVTYDGYSHFQLVQDEAKNATDVVLEHLKWLIAQHHRVEVFNCDRGRVLLNQKLTTYFTAQGIEYTWTNAYSPKENGLVERMNGVMAAQVRRLLANAHMPDLLWWKHLVMRLKFKLENPGKARVFMGFAKHLDSFRVLSMTCGNVKEVRSI
ncbi:Gag-pol Polyprotein [Phytophthora palmivora]|uniref:Gag-pol Polyprotein n=1 Tax=Phytophthora palmivora TaxID=4796 RepID=A0A2P4YFS0_9STRA|nr:Gag-pol Polyprotein [Phytophthora palmivora]